MSIFRRQKPQKPQRRSNNSAPIVWLSSDPEENANVITSHGYRTLDSCPEIRAGVQCIAELIASIPIHLIANGKKGDERIVNALSRRIDIEPNRWQTRTTWMQGILIDMLIYGNAVVIPQTDGGLLGDMIKLPHWSTGFIRDGLGYAVTVSGQRFDPADVLHFIYGPDADEPWRGVGLRVTVRDIVDNLAQAQATTKEFMHSKFHPSLIVSVDSSAEELSSPEGRKMLIQKYASETASGMPWMIPAEMLKVEQVKPMSLRDLAISETTTLDKQAVAAILGVPAFVLGVGPFSRDEWNAFIQRKIVPLCKSITQELTKKLIISEKWYFRANVSSLYSYDVQALGNLLGNLWDRGIVNGDEVRERLNMGLNPAGLTEFKALENYIPVDKAGDQKKLKQED